MAGGDGFALVTGIARSRVESRTGVMVGCDRSQISMSRHA